MISTSEKNIYSLIDLKKNVPFSYKQVLSCKALKFIAELHMNFNGRRNELLTSSNGRQCLANRNKMPESLSRPKNIRNGELAYELAYRKIEIVSPTDQDIIKNAFSSSSCLFIVDFENINLPNWENIIEGQVGIKEIINNYIMNEADENANSEILIEKLVPPMIHPRSLFINEKNLLVDEEPVSAAFFDFGLFFFHNAKKLFEQGYVPYIYLSSIENHQEARLWNDVFIFAEEQLRLPIGITKAAA